MRGAELWSIRWASGSGEASLTSLVLLFLLSIGLALITHEAYTRNCRIMAWNY
jgi:hypothetical protein